MATTRSVGFELAGFMRSCVVYNRFVKWLYDEWRGLIALLFVGAIAAFTATKHLWFDALPAGDKTVFWTNLGVAAGTLALAFVTWWNVRQTSLVLSAEDRRMQQRFSPYLTARFNTVTSEEEPDAYNIVGFRITNSGYGIARDVHVCVEAIAANYNSEKPLSQRIESAKPYLEGHWVLETTYDVIAEKTTVPASTSHSTYKNREYTTPDYATTLVVEARIRYVDMFGNRYETVYVDWDRRESRWITPEHLRL